MRNRLIYVVIMTMVSSFLPAQLRIQKPVKTYPKSTGLYFSAGIGRSVLYLERNVKENNDATGYYLNIQYGGSKLFRLSTEYTYYRPISIAPTWTDIKASTFEMNLQVIARFNQAHAFFYPIFGLSFNRFSGFFTGKNDFMSLANHYPINSTVVNQWVGVNAGTGYEYFYKRVGFFVEYKMRVGIQDGNDRKLNIMDVCYALGIKYNLRVRSIYSIMKGTRNRYFLNSQED